MSAIDNKSESRLIIKAYSDSNFSEERGAFSTTFNPSDIRISSSLNYNFSTGLGSPSNYVKYNTSPPKILDFVLCFDATGVYNGRKDDVHERVNDLNNLMYDFKEDLKSPYYIRVIWGVVDFKGRLSSMETMYTMFEPNGKPIRAQIEISVVECNDKMSVSAGKSVSGYANSKSGDSSLAGDTSGAANDTTEGVDSIDSIRGDGLGFHDKLGLGIGGFLLAGALIKSVDDRAKWVKQKA
jgi:hypothetical protein